MGTFFSNVTHTNTLDNIIILHHYLVLLFSSKISMLPKWVSLQVSPRSLRARAQSSHASRPPTPECLLDFLWTVFCAELLGWLGLAWDGMGLNSSGALLSVPVSDMTTLVG